MSRATPGGGERETPSAAEAREHDLGDASQFGDAGPFAASAGGRDLVVVRAGGELAAFDGRCPHQGALLGEGEIEGGHLVCRNHRWRFDVTTGRRVRGKEALERCPLRIRGERVLVDVSVLTALSAAADGELRRVEDLPGPTPLPLVGNALSLDPVRLHTVVEGFAREHGSAFKVSIGPRTFVVLSDLADIERALRARPDTFRRISTVESIFTELGVNGVFSAEGESWRAQRKLSMEALSQRHLRGFFPQLREVTERLVRRWTRLAEAGGEIDILSELKRFTVDVTTWLTFGYDANTIDGDDDAVIQRHLEVVFPAINRRLNALLPYWRFVKLPDDRRLEASLAKTQAWIGARVDDARGRLEREPERRTSPRDFLEAMLVARDEHGEPFGDEVIHANALTMLLAGEDTTAGTLAWAAHELSRHGEVARELRAEADAVLGALPVAATLDAAAGLKLAGAVANETMRLRPVAPLIFLESKVDTSLAGVAMPQGTALLLLMRRPATHADAFDAPAEFRPRRWLDDASGAHEPAANLPFGSGPRICPGRSLALLEMRVALSSIFKAFDVHRVGADVVWERFSFTMEPARLRLRISVRAARGPA
jgi:cytochrome P450/nitrite reductase/ring-hydroxylating ferredoxin subunit